MQAETRKLELRDKERGREAEREREREREQRDRQRQRQRQRGRDSYNQTKNRPGQRKLEDQVQIKTAHDHAQL